MIFASTVKHYFLFSALLFSVLLVNATPGLMVNALNNTMTTTTHVVHDTRAHDSRLLRGDSYLRGGDSLLLAGDRNLAKCDQCNSCQCDANCDCIGGGGGSGNKCDQCNSCQCDANCDCIGGGGGSGNKCDQCNFCQCDANCDCIGGGASSSSSGNKCDQCNFCPCDDNCDCLVGGGSSWNKCDQCNSCKCDANCDCIAENLPLPVITPIVGCDGNGGACQCATGGDGLITLNRFWGDDSDERVNNCGGAFHLSGADLGAQWGGSQNSAGGSIGLAFSQAASHDGWEGCCYVCGINLELAGRLSSGWYCQKDTFSTGIWLKGVNKQ